MTIDTLYAKADPKAVMQLKRKTYSKSEQEGEREGNIYRESEK